MATVRPHSTRSEDCHRYYPVRDVHAHSVQLIIAPCHTTSVSQRVWVWQSPSGCARHAQRVERYRSGCPGNVLTRPWISAAQRAALTCRSAAPQPILCTLWCPSEDPAVFHRALATVTMEPSQGPTHPPPESPPRVAGSEVLRGHSQGNTNGEPDLEAARGAVPAGVSHRCSSQGGSGLRRSYSWLRSSRGIRS